MARNWGRPTTNNYWGTEALSSVTGKELNAANKCQISMEVVSSSAESSDETNTLIASSWKTLQQQTQLSHIWITDHRNCRLTNVCFFKMLNLGIIYYTKIVTYTTQYDNVSESLLYITVANCPCARMVSRNTNIYSADHPLWSPTTVK